jgi:hypothetical protein
MEIIESYAIITVSDNGVKLDKLVQNGNFHDSGLVLLF